jgi:hypothetical protein
MKIEDTAVRGLPAHPTYEVGYCRPPQWTRWQKGKSGNPKRIRKQNLKSIVDMIDEFFAGEIDILESGISRRVSQFEAIVLQLWIKAMAGKKRAMNVLLQYQEFAARRSCRDRTQIEVMGEDTDPEEPGGNHA